jgi:hypothetical protein
MGIGAFDMILASDCKDFFHVAGKLEHTLRCYLRAGHIGPLTWSEVHIGQKGLQLIHKALELHLWAYPLESSSQLHGNASAGKEDGYRVLLRCLSFFAFHISNPVGPSAG